MERLVIYFVIALATHLTGVTVTGVLTESRPPAPGTNLQVFEPLPRHVLEAVQAPSVAQEPRAVSTDEKDLLMQVRLFSEDIGEIGRRAWRKLENYPRHELIKELSRIQGSTSDESVRADIAFVFCNLGHEYPKNRAILIFAFKHSLEEGRGPAEDYEGLIDRLIRKGDRSLLRNLFAAAPRSDGALSEGLAGTFADQMERSPEQFLAALKSEPRAVRREVYELLSYAMSDNDKIMEVLRAVPRDSPIAGMAEEMAQELSKAKRED